MPNIGNFDTLTVTGNAKVDSLTITKNVDGLSVSGITCEKSPFALLSSKLLYINRSPQEGDTINVATLQAWARDVVPAHGGGPGHFGSKTIESPSSLVLQPEGGNVGIGTKDPQAPLDINGWGGIKINSGKWTKSAAWQIFHNADDGTNDYGLRFERDGKAWLVLGNQAVNSTSFPEGNVGIGTEKPGNKLTINGGNIQAILGSPEGPSLRLVNTNKPALGNEWAIYNMTAQYGDSLQFWNYGSNDGWGNKFTITDKGNVGIGTENPLAKLEVNGSIRVTGDGDVILMNADCAEEFDVAGAELVEPGTVMVINSDGALQPGEQAYDKRVAGVISGAGDLRPGITLGRQDDKTNRLPLALTGTVYCKVDAQYGAIEVGDLLTTSPTCGHAMKASDPGKAFGTVIGKALRELTVGTGLIPILVALQ